MDKPGNDYSKSKQPDTKGYTLYDSVYVNFQNKPRETEHKPVVARRWGKGMGVTVLMYSEVAF